MAPRIEEKRGFMRVPFSTEVEIKAGDHTIRSTSGINISLSGLCLSTEEPTPLAGDACSVKISLGEPDHRVTIKAKGSVIRTGAGQVVVQFSELDFASYHHLRQLIIYNVDDPEQAEREFSSHWEIRRPAPREGWH